MAHIASLSRPQRGRLFYFRAQKFRHGTASLDLLFYKYCVYTPAMRLRFELILTEGKHLSCVDEKTAMLYNLMERNEG